MTDGNAVVRLERIYLKDASFESPGTPDVFAEQWQPQVKLDINSRANQLAEQQFEVVLTASITTKRTNGKTAFIVEVQQAGIFALEGLTDEQRRQALATVCPSTLFPYIREAVDSLVVKGGFPALHLAPVNFEALYRERVAANAANASGASDAAPETTH